MMVFLLRSLSVVTSLKLTMSKSPVVINIQIANHTSGNKNFAFLLCFAFDYYTINLYGVCTSFLF